MCLQFAKYLFDSNVFLRFNTKNIQYYRGEKMKKSQFFIAVTLAIVVIALTACSGGENASGSSTGADDRGNNPSANEQTFEFSLGDVSEESGEYVMGYGSYPHMAGVGLTAPLMEASAVNLLGMSAEDAEFFTDCPDDFDILDQFEEQYNIGSSIVNRTEVAPQDPYLLMEDTPYDLVLIQDYLLRIHDIEPREVALADTKTTPFASDALVFYVSENNPVESLTMQQLSDILTGEISSWDEVGGTSDDVALYMEQVAYLALPFLVTDFEEIIEPVISYQDINNGVGESPGYYSVGEYSDFAGESGDLGYVFLSQLEDTKGIKILSIDGVAPNMDALDKYPLSFNYVAYYFEADASGSAGNYANWLVSEAGQKVVVASGLKGIKS